ncbi:MAG: SurA N-terminal domain-containing protein [Pseudomonadota bacterium]
MKGFGLPMLVSAGLLAVSLGRAQPDSQPGRASAEPVAVRQEVLVEALVATVNQSVITLGQVEAEARLVLLRRGGAAGAERAIDDGLRAAVLQYMINQEIILAEARRLQLFQVPEEAIHDEVVRIARLFGDRDHYLAFLAHQGLSESDVVDIVRRDLRVARFLKSRVQMMARLSPDEVQVYYNAHAADFPERSLDEVRAEVEDRLGRERHDQAIRDWVGELKARAEIRILRSFETEAVPEPAP